MNTPLAFGIRNVGTMYAGTCTGTTVTRVIPTANVGTSRSGIQISNLDATNEIWVVLAQSSAATPTISSTSLMYRIAPKTGPVVIGCAQNVIPYVLNSTGAATTTAYTAQEYSF